MDYSIPWIEKYRPCDLTDVVLDELISDQLNIFINDRSNVHLIITGVPGIGKTSTVRCIAKKTLQKHYDEGYLELNSAEDRGIKNISTIITTFCRKLIILPNPKIILLDEAENMTSKGQYDIYTIMKLYGKNNKFIFVCNDSSKIIEDIQSICRILRFKKLTNVQICDLLKKICYSEKINFDEKGLDTIFYTCDGDMRKAINNLQLTAFTFDKVTKKNVLAICNIPDPEDIRSIINDCLHKNLVNAYNNCILLVAKGYCYSDIITSFIYVVVEMKISEHSKLELIKIMNESKIHFSRKSRSDLQLIDMICKLINVSINN